MDALTTAVRDALVAEGACPATAEALAVDFVYRARERVEREKRDQQAQMLLPLGPSVAAQRLGVCRSAVYKMAKRFRTASTQTPVAVDG